VFDDDGRAHVGKDLSKARVRAKLLGDKKGEKVRVHKYRNKSGYRRQAGHRQLLTLLEVEEVALSPQQKSTATEAKRVPAPPPKKPGAKKPAAKKAPAKKPAPKKTTTRKKTTTTRKPATRKKST
jgi:large subunit ribosomal protein L21